MHKMIHSDNLIFDTLTKRMRGGDGMRRTAVLCAGALLLTGCGRASLSAPQPDAVCSAAETVPANAAAGEAAAWAAVYADEPACVRILLAHDALCARCTYDPEAPARHTAAGAWDGAAVCDGYAAAFSEMMRACGVPVLTVTGTADGIPHAWNLVALDGAWYHIDCTWDDRDDTAVSHTYFLCDDAFMQQTHRWDTGAYPSAQGCAHRYEEIVQGMLHPLSG